MNKKKCLIYDIVLDIVHTSDIFDYTYAYRRLESDLNNILSNYKGSSEIEIDIGNFEIKEPDQIVKKLLPHIHIIIYGNKLKSIEKELDVYLENTFIPNSFKKINILDTPFEKDNLQLFNTLCYTSNVYKLEKRTSLQKINI